MADSSLSHTTHTHQSQSVLTLSRTQLNILKVSLWLVEQDWCDLPTRGDPEPTGLRLFGIHARRALALGRSTGWVWVKPYQLIPQSWGPGRALYWVMMRSTVTSVWGAVPHAATADTCNTVEVTFENVCSTKIYRIAPSV